MLAKLPNLAWNVARATETRRREATAWLLGRARRPQIVLLHVPKCGGTSIKASIKPCIGSKHTGRRVKILHGNTDTLLKEPDAVRARAADFVYGRMSWSTLTQVRREDAFVFTMLRDPEARLLSLYNFFKRHPANYRAAFHNQVFDLASAMFPAEFFASPDPIIRYHVDNSIVRQFSGNPVASIPDTETEWRVALETAKRNLSSLSYVAFTETIDGDLTEILRLTGLPMILSTPRRNAAGDPEGASVHKATSDPLQARLLSAVLEPLVRWDRELVEFAASDASQAATLRSLHLHTESR